MKVIEHLTNGWEQLFCTLTLVLITWPSPLDKTSLLVHSLSTAGSSLTSSTIFIIIIPNCQVTCRHFPAKQLLLLSAAFVSQSPTAQLTFRRLQTPPYIISFARSPNVSGSSEVGSASQRVLLSHKDLNQKYPAISPYFHWIISCLAFRNTSLVSIINVKLVLSSTFVCKTSRHIPQSTAQWCPMSLYFHYY